MDADKEGFLRNQRSLIQTIGRAARNVDGRVIMYADTITDSMQAAIDETNRRRRVQQDYNEANGIVPRTVTKSRESILQQTKVADSKKTEREGTKQYYLEPENPVQNLAAEPVIAYMDAKGIEKLIAQTQKQMERAAKELDFIEAARLRDELAVLKKRKEELEA
jgi:excinuclease ABC subunit B